MQPLQRGREQPLFSGMTRYPTKRGSRHAPSFVYRIMFTHLTFDNDPFFLNFFAKTGFILAPNEKVGFDQHVDIHCHMVKVGHQLQVIDVVV